MRTQAEVVLRHLRGLAAGGDVPDGLLLERFTARHDEAAFAALVRRHGPLVYGVCRRVLHNEHDAEDAFQATFLVLARKAGSIAARDSVGSWLYQVARHMAMKARKRSDDRKGREGRAAARRPADPLEEISGRELLVVFDDELLKMSERDRAPLVLCYLQGLTRDEAARRLGCSESTLHRRLDGARERLRRRLERRGLALPAALLTAAAASSAVPAKLSAAAVRTAAGKAADVPAAVAALVRQALRTTAARAARAVGAVLLAVGVIAAGAGLVPARGPAGAAAADAPKVAPPAPEKKSDAPPPAPPVDEKKETIFSARVVNADGKAVDAAEVALVGMPKLRQVFANGWLEEKVLARGRADADGRFRIALADAVRDNYQDIYALAGKEGHGLIWGKAGAQTVLRLPPEKVVRGRVLDLQGLPAAGVEVRVEWLGTVYLKRTGGVGLGALSRDGFPAWPRPAVTDKDGRFTLGGLNPDFGGSLHVEGGDFGPQRVEIKPGAENKVQEVRLSLAPAHVLEGVVTAEDTGKPIAGARVWPLTAHAVQTDEKGHYRLRLPPDWRHTIEVTADDRPYVWQHAELVWPKGAVRHQLNIALKRGVLVRGKLTEAASGKPVAGALIHDTAHLWTRTVTSGPDGSFRMAVAKGRGRLLVKGPNNDYIATPITSGELDGNPPSGFRMYPDAIVPLDPKEGADTLDVSVKLRRGVTVRGRLLGPDDKPVADAVMLCWNQLRPEVSTWFASGMAVRDGTFELRGCDPELTYPVHFLDPNKQWGASVRVSAKEAGDKPLTVRLAKCGRAVVRFVDKAGKPVPGYSPYVNVVVRPGEKGIEADNDFVANVDRVNYTGGGGQVAGEDGKATFPALIPGVTYRLYGPGIKGVVEVTAKAGETRDVPDVVVER
jgi:RNA polymerase sigma factor (sigma-70 family)